MRRVFIDKIVNRSIFESMILISTDSNSHQVISRQLPGEFVSFPFFSFYFTYFRSLRPGR